MKFKSDFFYKLYHFEYWPAWAFYLPVYLLWPYFVWKGKSFLFFTVANPCIPYGGCFGESKLEILDLLDREFLPKTIVVSRESDLHGIKDFPLVAKPDIGERGDHVAIVASETELSEYFKKLKRPFILQEYLPSTFEAGVMVIRDPSSRKLSVTSVTVKSYLSVVGDGTTSLGALIQRSPRARFQWERLRDTLSADRIPVLGEVIVLEPIGNHCRGTTFHNANHLITPELCDALETALHPAGEFYFGRFDLKADSSDALMRGKSIKIMELNGAFSEPGHIYDPNERLWKSWRDLLLHWRRLAEVCGQNSERGFKAAGVFDFLSLYFNYRKLHQRVLNES